MNDEFLIWSEEHGAWWNPDSAGYTTSMAKAGVYTLKEAAKIVSSANGHGHFCEISIPVPNALKRLRTMPNGGR